MNFIKDFHGKKLTMSIGADHGGFELKNQLIDELKSRKIEIIDCGPFKYDAQDDYPDFAAPAAMAISCGKADCGILICRSGMGMAMAANRFHNVRYTGIFKLGSVAVAVKHAYAGQVILFCTHNVVGAVAYHNGLRFI
ncbi:MAG: RpiB/LacA/LacB family sugar-phosphate isomerase, partial [Victivallaceae bacterium]